MFASVLQAASHRAWKTCSLAAERRPVRGEGPLGEDGCSSTARLVFVARAAGRYAWGMMFKFGYIGRFSKGYEAMGYIIIASSIFSIFMRIKGQKTMFGTLEDQ